MDNKLAEEFKFKTFSDAVRFVNSVANLSEAYNHHPDIHVYYNRVVIELWTHETNNVTQKDIRLMSKIKKLVAS